MNRLASSTLVWQKLHKNWVQSILKRTYTQQDTVAAAEAANSKYINGVHRFIAQKIETTGPITVAEYMKICLTAPTAYYTGSKAQNVNLFGSQGDFLTSPEISQMFGEMLGLWMISEALNLGYSGRWRYVELGPGSGTLCKDVLSMLKKFRCDKDVTVSLVEISENMALAQKKLLCGSDEGPITPKEFCYLSGQTCDGITVEWYKHLDDVPQEYSVIVAHEFFDALPIHQFRRDEKDRWREVFVDIGEEFAVAMNEDRIDTNHTKLRFALPQSESVAQKLFIPERIANCTSEECSVYEVCPTAADLVEKVGNRITQDGGAAIIVDYGDVCENGDTLRGYRNHEQVDVLQFPGQSDITADINFSALTQKVQENVAIFGPVTQKYFLETLGIDFRLKQLLDNCSEQKTKDYLIESHKWLTSPEQMGTKFKVMALFPLVVKEALTQMNRPVGFQHVQKV